MDFPFRLAERDLDHMIIEELHADSGFAQWLLRQIGLPAAEFLAAKHSVVDNALGRTGESDLLVLYSTMTGRLVLLVEDKLTASFTENQARRYHDRGAKLVHEQQAATYRTALIAPRAYIEAVPPTEPWDHRLPLESIRDWFAAQKGSHANWRHRALRATLDRLFQARSASQDVVNRFSLALAAFLRTQTGDQLTHNPKRGGYDGMIVIHFVGKQPFISLNWKPRMARVELQMERQHVGKLRAYANAHGLPADAIVTFAAETGEKSDFLRVPGPPVDFSLRPEEQAAEMAALLSAAHTLAEIGRQIAAQSSVTDPGNS